MIEHVKMGGPDRARSKAKVPCTPPPLRKPRQNRGEHQILGAGPHCASLQRIKPRSGARFPRPVEPGEGMEENTNPPSQSGFIPCRPSGSVVCISVHLPDRIRATDPQLGRIRCLSRPLSSQFTSLADRSGEMRRLSHFSDIFTLYGGRRGFETALKSYDSSTKERYSC